MTLEFKTLLRCVDFFYVVEIEYDGRTKKLNLTEPKLIVDLMTVLEINPEAYISLLNGNVVTEDEIINEKDKVKFVRVWSGG